MRKSLLLLLAPLVLAACNTGYYVKQHFVIDPEEVVLPDTIAAGDTLRAQFFGTIGGSVCHRLAEIVTNKIDPSTVSFRLLGVYETSGGCEPKRVLLTNAKAAVAPPFSGPLTVRVASSRGEDREFTVVVK